MGKNKRFEEPHYTWLWGSEPETDMGNSWYRPEIVKGTIVFIDKLSYADLYNNEFNRKPAGADNDAFGRFFPGSA